MGIRPYLSVTAATGAVACLVGAVYLAFDWADYGLDSTCGNFIRYKGAGGTCAHIMRNRALGFAGLVVAAIVLLGVAWATRDPRPDAD